MTAMIEIEFMPESDVNAIAAAIRTHGMALVRQAAPSLVELLPVFEANLAAMKVGDGDPRLAPNVSNQAGSIWMVGGPDVVRGRIAILVAIASAYLGKESVYFDWELTRARRVPPAGQRIHGMHQDGVEVANLQMLTMWVALTNCGRDAPGLELVRVPNLEHAKLMPGDHWTHGESDPKRDKVVDTFGEGVLWRPELKAGDSIIFTDRIYHRTYSHLGMSAARTSIDFRVVEDSPNVGEWLCPIRPQRGIWRWVKRAVAIIGRG